MLAHCTKGWCSRGCRTDTHSSQQKSLWSVQWSWFSYWIRIEISSDLNHRTRIFSAGWFYENVLVADLHFTQSLGLCFLLCGKIKASWREIWVQIPCFNSHLTPTHCWRSLLSAIFLPLPSFHYLSWGQDTNWWKGLILVPFSGLPLGHMVLGILPMSSRLILSTIL